ncbi:hypothetical protein NN561_004835 [Cricetulus griseus]
MTRSWGNSEGRWPGGRKPRKVGTAEAGSTAGIREPGFEGTPWQCPGAPRTATAVSFPGPDLAGVLAEPQTEPRLRATVVPEPRPSRSPAPSARPLSPPSSRPRAGICEVAAAKFSPAPSLPALCLHWSLQRRSFPGASGPLLQGRWPPWISRGSPVC